MPKSSKQGSSRHVYLDKEQELILEVIGETMGKRRLGVKATRSQLIYSAVRNFIDENAAADDDMKEAINQARSKQVDQK